MNTILIGARKVGPQHPAYIIAEIGSNFDGDLNRAKTLAKRCKEVGADAYKIQNFLAPKIVSSEGFKNLQISFQAKWKRPVVDVYKAAEFPRDWVAELATYCRDIGIDFLSAPTMAAVDLLEVGVAPQDRVKEIDNLEFISCRKVRCHHRSAADIGDVEVAVQTIRSVGNEQIVVLQCVTNYPAPIADSNLRAMGHASRQARRSRWLPDHTIGPAQGGDDPLLRQDRPACGRCLAAVSSKRRDRRSQS
jgi:N-acetylneuraminate synthase